MTMNAADFLDPLGPTRVFRADTPQEVASASIVAGAIPPGRNVLMIYGGGNLDYPERAVASLRAMARAHPWEGILNLTDLPVGHVSGEHSGLASRLARTRAAVATVRGMRERLAEVLGVNAAETEAKLDEVYVPVLTSGTMVTAYALSRSARICCYPHTFASVGHERYRLELPRPFLGRIADHGKRMVWGADAVPRRSFHVELAVTFWRKPEWATETLSLGYLICESTMKELFGTLPEEVRRYFERLASGCHPPTGVLLLESGDMKPGSGDQPEIELRAYSRLVESLIRHERLESLVVKPHPRMPPERLEEVASAIRSGFPQLEVVAVGEHSSLPIEVVCAPFKLAACASIISTALCTLPLIHPVRSYCDRAAAEELWGDSTVTRILAEWKERVGDRLTPI